MENNNFVSTNFDRYVDRTIIYLDLCQKPPGRNFKKENKVSIFTLFEVFLILVLASHNVEKWFLKSKIFKTGYSSGK